MRKSIFILAAAVLVGFAACTDLTPDFSKEEKTCTLALSAYGDVAAVTTKTSDRNDEAWDTLVTTVQYIVYRRGTGSNSDKLYFYDRKTDTTRQHKKFINCAPGDYKVYAIINGPEYIPSSVNVVDTADLHATVIKLDANTKARGLVMYGTKNITITEDSRNQDCPIQVKRHVVRVNLVSITNDTEDAIDIKFRYAFLSNVSAKQNLEGSITHYTDYEWGNLGGRETGTSFIVMNDHVDYKEMTFYKPEDVITIQHGVTYYFKDREASTSTGHKFYGYPNDTQKAEDQYYTLYDPSASITRGRTRLVVVCEMHDVSESMAKDYYFPVNLDPFERSYTYDVKLKITGIGSDDPNTLVNKAGMTFEIDAWQEGSDYSEDF